jgi:hypothetical protein
MFWKLLNDQQEGIKDLEKAMWLVVGTDPTAPQTTVGERNGDLSGPAIRSFGDGVVHGIYDHPKTTVDEHYYAKADLTADMAENAGVNKVDGQWLQVDIIDGDKLLSEILPSAEFPNGAFLRKLKHRFFNMLLKGNSLKIYIPHLRGYIKDQMFLKQWELMEEGKDKNAREIRWRNINHARAGRRVRKVLKDNGTDKELDNALNLNHNPEGADGDEPAETVSTGSRELFMKKYKNPEEVMNLFDLPRGTYDLRVNKLVYPWGWDPDNPGIIKEWIAFTQNPTWSIDLPF